MKCPVCAKEMLEKDFGGVLVDVCADGCKGLWFDWFELAKLDEVSEGAGQALSEALATERVSDEGRGQINCPKCAIPMHIHKYRHEHSVSVDECYQCAGFFLDAGELKAIRDGFMDEAQIKEFTDNIIKDIPEISSVNSDQQKVKVRTNALYKFAQYLSSKY